MKFSKKFEQGICVLAMLALEKEHKPLKSSVLSKKLEVSDSYLKKILGQLVKARILESSASKTGGFILLKNIEDISIYDVYIALEKEKIIEDQGMIEKIFFEKEKMCEGKEVVFSLLAKAEERFEEELKNVYISDLLIKENYLNGVLEWNEI